eukprot:381146_1
MTIIIYPISPSLYYHLIIILYIQQYQWYSQLFEFQEKIDDIEQLISQFQIDIDPETITNENVQKKVETFNHFAQIIGHHLVQIFARPSLTTLRNCIQTHIIKYLASEITDIASHIDIEDINIITKELNYCKHESNIEFEKYLKRRSFSWCKDFICCKLLMGRILLLFSVLCVIFWITVEFVIKNELSEEDINVIITYYILCHGLSFLFMIILIYIAIHLEIQTMWQLHSWLHPEGEIGIYAAVHKYLRIRLLNSFIEIIRFIYQYQMVCNYIGDLWFRNELLQYLGMQQLIVPAIKEMITPTEQDETIGVINNNIIWHQIIEKSDTQITMQFNGFGPIPDVKIILNNIETLKKIYMQLLTDKTGTKINKFYLNTVLL